MRRARVAAALCAALLCAGNAVAVENSVSGVDPSDPEASTPNSNELYAKRMTYIGSRDAGSELVLKSDSATFYPDRDFANLRDVHAVFTDDTEGESFDMTCDRAALNVVTNDFRAEGRVHGSTSSGQQYSAPWVEYDHADGVLHTDAPVVMVDDTGTFRGVGFVYRVEERTFKLLGNVTVEQDQ